MLQLPFCPEAVIFDMDGLLVDSEPVWEVVEHDMINRRGRVMTAEVRSPLIGLRMRDFWSGMREALALEDSVEVLATEVVERFLAGLPEGAPERPGASRLIRTLQAQGLPMAIASSSPLAIINGVVGARGWDDAFPIRVTGDEVPEGKPAPDIYLEACRRLGADPRRSLALEDSRNGARAAAAAGLITVAVPDLSHTEPALFAQITPYLAHSLDEVRAALEGLGCLTA